MDSISDLAGAVRRGERSAIETVGAALDAAEASQPDLNAFTTVDRDGALASAASIDEQIARGQNPGPLAGVPIGLKDLIDQAGVPTTNGAVFETRPATASAVVVQRLENAGAVIIGRTGLHEFAFGFTSENQHFGPVRNPWDLSLSPGGSSGGSAAAVAAGIVPAAIGTDTGGSVRVPAAGTAPWGRAVARSVASLSPCRSRAGHRRRRLGRRRTFSCATAIEIHLGRV